MTTTGSNDTGIREARVMENMLICPFWDCRSSCYGQSVEALASSSWISFLFPAMLFSMYITAFCFFILTLLARYTSFVSMLVFHYTCLFPWDPFSSGRHWSLADNYFRGLVIGWDGCECTWHIRHTGPGTSRKHYMVCWKFVVLAFGYSGIHMSAFSLHLCRCLVLQPWTELRGCFLVFWLGHIRYIAGGEVGIIIHNFFSWSYRNSPSCTPVTLNTVNPGAAYPLRAQRQNHPARRK